MTHNYIYKKALRIAHRCGTRDPMRIAKELGIHVQFSNEFQLLKGMYCVIDRSRFIIINANLSERDKKTVCAHEIGHDVLHRQIAKVSPFQEFGLYDIKSRTEYEANIFASDLLIDDDEILTLINEDYDICHIAGELDADINIVLIKVDELRRRGYNVKAPYRPRSDFLK